MTAEDDARDWEALLNHLAINIGPAPEIVPEITPHPSHDMWWRRPDSGECNNCAMCTCCDSAEEIYGPCKSYPAQENP